VDPIRELTEIDDLRQLAELFAALWGRPGEPPINSDVLKALSHSGNYVVGAFQEGRMVGGLVGWLGGDPIHELHMHSHILGVVPDLEARGLGFELKQHQRRWCLERDVKIVEWTTDPLVRRNGYFNLTKLGARAPEYLVNVYGEMKDEINAGEQSDRLLIRWFLDSPGAERARDGRAAEPNVHDLMAGGADVLLSVGVSGEPVDYSLSMGTKLLCQVPDDIVALRRYDAALARSWRLALREVMTSALARGYEITGATRSGWYVLELT
jgi:predicted GNAT superfamily acetyltransferase